MPRTRHTRLEKNIILPGSGATFPYREFSYGEFPMRQSNFRSGATSPYGDFLYKEILHMKNSLYGEVAPLLKLDWRIGNFPMGKFCIGSSL